MRLALSDVDWQTVKWPDGSSYEGLVKGNLCHGRGVTVFPDGDRYEGEYFDNHMDGVGVYTWKDGVVYQGCWKQDQMHGCGVKRSMQESGQISVKAGLFQDDVFKGSTPDCDDTAVQQSVQAAHNAARQARGLLRCNAATGQNQQCDRPPLLSHAEAFSLRPQTQAKLKGGHQEANADAAAASGLQSVTVKQQSSESRLKWVPWSLWHI